MYNEDMSIDNELNTTIIFPGQGSQHKGMLADLLNNKLSKDIINSACEISSLNLIDIIENNKINSSLLTQVTILVTSYALYKSWLYTSKADPRLLLGHSLGEYTALLAAQAIDLETAINIVKKRAQLMEKASNEASMLALIGADFGSVAKLCSKVDKDYGTVEIANINSQKQIVVAGTNNAINELKLLAKDYGVRKLVPLNVKVASHCSLMKPIVNEFRAFLDTININTPKIKVLHNANLKAFNKEEEIKQSLLLQLYSPVNFLGIIQHLIDLNVHRVIECGPLDKLTKLVKQIIKYNKKTLDDNSGKASNNLECLTINSIKDINNILEESVTA